MAYVRLGRHERAIEDYDEAIKLDPQYSSAYNNRGSAYVQLGQPERAIEDLDEAVRLEPQNPQVYYNRGVAYGRLAQHERAIKDYDEAIRLDPQYSKAYGYRADAYCDLGELERAIKDYDEAIRLDPQRAAAMYNNRGRAYCELNQHERAIKDCDEAIKLDPQIALAYNNRGLAYSGLDQHKRAIQDHDEAIKLDPQPAFYYNRGGAYAELGQHVRALEDYDEAIKLDPQAPDAIQYRIAVYAYFGHFERANKDSNESFAYAYLGNHNEGTYISSAEAQIEYWKFVDILRNRQPVWALQNDGDWANWNRGEIGEPGFMPFWSSHEGAQACAEVSFPGYRPVPLTAEEFIDDWLPMIQEDGLFVGVNMTDKLLGIDVRPSELLRDGGRPEEGGA